MYSTHAVYQRNDTHPGAVHSPSIHHDPCVVVQDWTLPIDERVADLVSRLTLTEKINQVSAGVSLAFAVLPLLPLRQPTTMWPVVSAATLPGVVRQPRDRAPEHQRVQLAL